MIVAVTGAGGFIGRHLVRSQLQMGRQVRAIDLALDGLRAEDGLQPIQADIRDSEAMRKALQGTDAVFHLAAAHLSLTLSEEDYWEINCDAARQLVEIAHQEGAARFVHCSSAGVYGELKAIPADEETPCNPGLIYEKSKLAGEDAVREYGRSSGYPVATLRPVWVYGPGCHRTEKLFRAIGKGRFVLLGDGRTMRHCIYIDDMIEAFNLCAEHPGAAGQTFIAGDESAVTVRSLLNEIAAAVGARPPRISLPLWAARPAFFLIEKSFQALGKEPPVSRRSLKFFTNNTSFVTAKIRQELGFRPQFSLQGGLRATAERL